MISCSCISYYRPINKCPQRCRFSLEQKKAFVSFHIKLWSGTFIWAVGKLTIRVFMVYSNLSQRLAIRFVISNENSQ